MRLNITFDKETLRLADREARKRKMSRSEFIRNAVRELALDRDSQQETRRNRQLRAIRGMRELARKAGRWPAVEILHSWRYRLGRDHK